MTRPNLGCSGTGQDTAAIFLSIIFSPALETMGPWVYVNCIMVDSSKKSFILSFLVRVLGGLGGLGERIEKKTP